MAPDTSLSTAAYYVITCCLSPYVDQVKGKDQVGATMDFMELERQRGITIQVRRWLARSLCVQQTHMQCCLIDVDIEFESIVLP